MRIGSVLKHSAQVVAEGSLIALLVVGLMAGSVFAGKGGAGGGGGGKPGGGGSTGGSGTLALVLLNGDTAPHYGGQVTFTVSTTASANPQVSVKCSQGGVLVLSGSAGFGVDDPWAWAQIFTLSSAAWTGGAADCTATLYYWNGKTYSTLKTLGFHADA